MLNRLALVLPAALLAAGCNLADELKPKVSPSNAFIGGQAAGTSAENSASQYDPVGGTAVAPGDCGAGTYTDADGDTWPDALTSLTWDTCVKDSALGTVTLNGSIGVTDTNLGTRDLGVTADPIAMNITIVDAPDNVNVALVADGSATGSGAGTVVWNAHNEWSGNIDDVTLDIEEDIDWTTVYTPSTTWAPGDPIVAGTLTVEGDWTGDIDGDTVDGEVDTGAGLTVDPACSSKITGGTLTITWDNGPRDGEITVTWSACNDRDVEVDL